MRGGKTRRHGGHGKNTHGSQETYSVSPTTALLVCTGKGDVQQPWTEKCRLTQGSDQGGPGNVVQVSSPGKSPSAEALAEGEGTLQWIMEEGTK